MAVDAAFVPHPLFRGGHAQTLAAYLFKGSAFKYAATQHRLEVSEGDQVVLHDDRPEAWRDGGRCALLLHGLAGCHLSPYMQRMAAKLTSHNVRTFRMDLRGCGAGIHLARHSYHSGRSDDAQAALEHIASICPGSPVVMMGFSLGGNIALKLAGECGDNPPGGLERVAAVCPPIDLSRCVKGMQRGANRLYDRYFAKLLVRLNETRWKSVADAVRVDWCRPPTTLFDFDNVYTGPVNGFGDAMTYYERCSSAPLLRSIRVPTLILAGSNDPIVPPDNFENLNVSDAVRVVLEPGGHLGFFQRPRQDPDFRWMDWRLLAWAVQSHEVRAE